MILWEMYPITRNVCEKFSLQQVQASACPRRSDPENQRARQQDSNISKELSNFPSSLEALFGAEWGSMHIRMACQHDAILEASQKQLSLLEHRYNANLSLAAPRVNADIQLQIVKLKMDGQNITPTAPRPADTRKTQSPRQTKGRSKSPMIMPKSALAPRVQSKPSCAKHRYLEDSKPTSN